MSKEVFGKSATCYAAVGPKQPRKCDSHTQTLNIITQFVLFKTQCSPSLHAKLSPHRPIPAPEKGEKEEEEAEKEAIFAVVFVKQ